MTSPIEFNSTEDVHRYFSAFCFNRTWDLLDKTDRTPEEDEEMIHTCLASLWHWSQRSDCTALEKSVGTWQASRVYAVLNQVENALRFGQMSLEYSHGLPPFFQAYAHEALARAEVCAGNLDEARKHHRLALDLTSRVIEKEDRSLLENDLNTIF